MGGAHTRAGARVMTTTGMGLVLVVGMILGPSVAADNTTPPAGFVDLVVEVAARPAMAGSVIQYESLIRNRGTQVAEQVEGTFVIPAASVAVDLASQSCILVGSMRLDQDGSAFDQPWTVTCDLGTLAPGEEKRVQFSVALGVSGTRVSVVAVSSNGPDGRPFDNRVEAPLYVLPDTPGFIPAFQQPGQPNPMGRATV